MKYWKAIALLPLMALLCGCDFVVLRPAGDIAIQQRNLVVISTALMLLIILPVIVLIAVFAWRYRQTNASARYEPDWDHSTQLELVIWSAPLLIIICLGAMTWMGTHLLDPYRTLDRIAADRPVPASAKPLEVDVVALDWKWLFIYPEQGFAVVNEMAAPVDRPISFRITASSVMNSFYIPALAGQIYAMPAMETKLHAVINKTGVFKGFSANYSGAGFSGMRFNFHALDGAGFDGWVAKVKANSAALGRAEYLQLAKPSENDPIRYFGTIDPELFKAILDLCVEKSKMCMSDMTSIDARGGFGLAGVNNTLPRTGDKPPRRGAIFGPAPSYVAGICTVAEIDGGPANTIEAPRMSPVFGAGLKRAVPLPLRPSSSSLLIGPRPLTDS